MALKSINPYNGELLGEFDEHGSDYIKTAIEKAGLAYKIFCKTSFKYRAEQMLKCAEILRKNKKSYALTITGEMGKVIRESVSEVEKSAWVCEYYAQHAERFLMDEKLKVNDGTSYLVYDPLGIILAVMPWNFPLYQVFRFAPPAIMAGNVVLLKHASNVPQCALLIEDVFKKAGFEEGIFQTLLVGSGKVNSIIDNPGIRAITITGSTEAGRNVAQRAGLNIKKSVLELGGSDPFIILKDADINSAAEIAAKARMINCGQSCIAAKRFIIEEDIYDQFILKFQENLHKLKFGNPLDESSDYASMANVELREILAGQVKKSLENGANILWRDKKTPDKGTFYNPTIISDITAGMPAHEEELFGPVASVFRVKDVREAIEKANSSEFGLGASIWSQDIKKAQNIARDVESGVIYINGMVASRPEIPFGGVKKSGFGRELSYLGIREFVNQKTVFIK
jgi:succinate-semialdehyde dehydrogenase/glutarate-semialdehyde dehydrogenase